MNKNVNCFRLSDETAKQIKSLAEREECSQGELISRAVQLYADSRYLNESAVTINDSIVAVTNAIVSGMEHRLNNRANQLLSSIAIELYILQRIIAENLDVDFQNVLQLQDEAKLIMSEKNRMLEMSEILEE